MGDLETLEAIAAFSFLSNDIENRIDEFGTFSVMTFGPVVTLTGLTENKVIRTEQLTKWTSAHGIHGTRFQIHEDGTWNITSASGFVVVHVDTLQLQVAVTLVVMQIISIK